MTNMNESVVYLHGGMSGELLFDDLWTLDLKTLKWTCTEQSHLLPCARAAHSSISVNQNLYIFGGIDKNGTALDDLWKYNTGNLTIRQLIS